MFRVLLERQNKVSIGDTVWLSSFESCFVTTIPAYKSVLWRRWNMDSNFQVSLAAIR